MRTWEQWRELALATGHRLGFAVVGIAGVEPSARLAAFPDWIESGQAGAMAYLARRGEDGGYLRERIQSAWPWARTVLCAGVVYNTAQPRSTEFAGDGERGWISRYAWGEDYHLVLREKLEAWIERLRAEAAPEEQFRASVDTAPLVEREAAWRAGLGWQGKNTCLIHPQLGSYFCLGTVITSVEMGGADAPVPDRCGSCTRCLDACPTQALTPYHMDASRCLAYLNIELRGAIPEPLRPAMGNNVLGCDICQDVCPWNRRAAVSDDAAFQPRAGMVAPRLSELARMSKAEYRERFRRSAVKRAKFAGLRRNVAVAMGNSGRREFLPQLQEWEADEDAVLAEHATWGSKRILEGGSDAH
ncbi:MAG: tRNA epoxyqueuosine(34) reductase QueG [Terriglobales bacterium]